MARHGASWRSIDACFFVRALLYLSQNAAWCDSTEDVARVAGAVHGPESFADTRDSGALTFGAYDESTYSIENSHFYIAVIRCVSVTLAFTSIIGGRRRSSYRSSLWCLWDFGRVLSLASWHPTGCCPRRLSSGSCRGLTVRRRRKRPKHPSVITAVMHFHVFGYDQFLAAPGANPPLDFADATKHAFSITDVVGDTVAAARDVADKAKKQN